LLNTTAYQLPSLSFVSPVEGRITTHFNLAEGHYGIDIVGVKQAPIRAIATGRVVLSNWTVETGWILVIQHGQGLLSVYKHNEILFKNEGNVVKSGQVVALMGNTGEFSTGPHLHFELWHNSEPLNPEDFMVF
jgi:murein DD-endopeptidase MepM/ murein hydrolase activator NlpD